MSRQRLAALACALLLFPVPPSLAHSVSAPGGLRANWLGLVLCDLVVLAIVRLGLLLVAPLVGIGGWFR